jgi:hypothetical protein
MTTLAAFARRLSAWWLADAPAERLAALRIVIGAWACAYVALRIPELASLATMPARQFEPVGAARLIDAPLPTAAVVAIAVATVLLLAAFTAGAAWRLGAPLAAAALVWTTSYRNSWGMTFHTENLLVLHVVALACTPAADAWAVGAAMRRARAAIAPHAGYGWGVRLLAALTAATYLLAGIAKLRLAGAAWLDGGLLRDQIAVDNVRKAMLGDVVAPLARVLVANPAWLAVLAAGTMVIELGAPLALVGGRAARMWAAGAWAFHLGVVLAMNIWFAYPLLGPAFLPLLAPDELWRGARARVREWRRSCAG